MVMKLFKENLFAMAMSFSPLFSFAQANVITTSYKFDFGSGKTQRGYVKITPGTTYTSQRGYGFDFGSSVTAKDYPGDDALRDDYITGTQPFYFSVRVHEGNYNVKVILGDKNGESVTTIKAENRRLMVERLHTASGKFATVKFTVHIRDSLITGTDNKVRLKPREREYKHWDDKLTLEFSNTSARVCAVEITPAVDAITLFLAGNSTVVDQADEPWAAWGQMIPAFFQPEKIAIANHAESGESLKAFKNERRLEKIWSMVKPGDYLFIEFTHNDQKPGSNHLDAFTTYKSTLKEWIEECRRRKVRPVLVTSMHRRNFDSTGHVVNTLGDYPQAMRETASEEHVPLIDLNAASKTLFEAWGPEKSMKGFVHYPAHSFPGQDSALRDNTHFSSYGAYELARCVVEGIKKVKLPLVKFLKKDLSPFDPAHPDPFEKWNLPASVSTNTIKPDGN